MCLKCFSNSNVLLILEMGHNYICVRQEAFDLEIVFSK